MKTIRFRDELFITPAGKGCGGADFSKTPASSCPYVSGLHMCVIDSGVLKRGSPAVTDRSELVRMKLVCLPRVSVPHHSLTSGSCRRYLTSILQSLGG